MKRAAICLAGLLAVCAGLCMAWPEPAVVQRADFWTLEVVFEHPRQITVDVPGRPGRRFWYVIMTLTNNTGKGQVPFYPACQILTDTFQTIPAGGTATKSVFQKVKLLHEGQYPFLEYIDFVDNRILAGADNRKDIAVIWPDFDLQAREIQIFISGLSNETVSVEHPTKKDSDGKPVKVCLAKTLALGYKTGSDPQLRDRARLIFDDKKWIMR